MSRIRVLLAARPSLSRQGYYAELLLRGIEVQLADDGEQCTKFLRESQPDVLVLEAELPHGGGDGVLEAVHESLRARRVPVFVLTTERNRSVMYRISRFEIGNLAVGPQPADQLADRVARLAAKENNLTSGRHVCVAPGDVGLET